MRLRRPFPGRFVLKAVPGPTDVRPMRSVRPSTHQAAVLALLRRGPMHLDALCRELTLRPRQVRTAIDHLRAGGTHVQRVAHKTWRAAA